MAYIKITTFLTLFTLIAAESQSTLPVKETKMSLFFHDFAGGPNATVVPVAGIPTKEWGFLKFGTIFVTDDPITEGIDLKSKEVARGQGMYITSSLDGGSTHVQVSIAFTNEDYNGSTLELQGRSIQLATVREVAIVSGAGKFRFARGYATFETVYLEPSMFYSVERCNLTVLHC